MKKDPCAIAVVQCLPYMTVSWLYLGSGHCLWSFSCHHEVLRVHLERRHSTSVHYY